MKLKETTKTFPFFHEYNDITLYANACASWHTQFEKEVKEWLKRLEQPRAGSIWDQDQESAMRYVLKEILGLPTDKDIEAFMKRYRELFTFNCHLSKEGFK